MGDLGAPWRQSMMTLREYARGFALEDIRRHMIEKFLERHPKYESMEITDAIKKRALKKNSLREHPRTETVRLSAEAGGRDLSQKSR
jgi:hypothetical protein